MDFNNRARANISYISYILYVYEQMHSDFDKNADISKTEEKQFLSFKYSLTHSHFLTGVQGL